jgi:tryptophan synthase beta chain
VGGGSNAIGFFFDFLEDLDVRLVGVEAGGRSLVEGEHAARFEGGKLGILQGCKTWILQNKDGQINQTHSVSAGLDYAAIGPEHAFYRDRGRIDFANAGDEDALEAFKMLSSEEGILPALETSHGLAYAFKRAGELTKDHIICVNLSGRGDKDAMEAARVMGVKDLPDMHL